MNVLLRVSAVLTCFGVIYGAKLPNYFTPCHKSDKDLNGCGLSQAKTAIKAIINGDKNFRLPVLSPLTLPEVTISPSSSLTMKFKNLTITGLETSVVKGVQIEADKNRWTFEVEVDYLNMMANYEMKGQILILPVVGKGPANITFARSTFKYVMNYKFIEKKGNTHAKIENPTLTYETDRTYYQFDNLFNGDPRLGPEVNNFLNENWKEVAVDIGPAFTETVSTIITSIASSYLNGLPFNVILPD